jgi:hypothetical protein
MNRIHSLAGVFLVAAFLTAGCSGTGNKKNKTMEDEFSKGTYGYDAAFLISTILKPSNSGML